LIPAASLWPQTFQEVSLIGSVDKTVPVVPEERGTWPPLCFPTSLGVPQKAATLEAH